MTDPRDDLIERMAKAMFAVDANKHHFWPWAEQTEIIREKYREHARAALAVVEEQAWRPIERAPKDGAFLVCNRLRQVCSADSQDGHIIIHNKPGFADWTFGQNATEWCPFPAPPATEGKEP